MTEHPNERRIRDLEEEIATYKETIELLEKERKKLPRIKQVVIMIGDSKISCDLATLERYADCCDANPEGFTEVFIATIIPANEERSLRIGASTDDDGLLHKDFWDSQMYMDKKEETPKKRMDEDD